ncbi:MAG: hypothetical protein NW208_09460 [Bryobacter sp.]|nr:hypothetical protein [Bryobacter sp.]
MKNLLALLFLAATAFPSTYYVNIGGLGGQEDYAQRFQSAIEELDKLTKATPDAKVLSAAGANATHARIKAILEEVAKTATEKDVVVVTLIGHGTFDGETYKFNLPGPDFTARELAQWLLPVKAKRQVVVNTTSSSGGSVKELQRDGRVVISATKTGTERLAPVFGRYWLEALRDPQADADKNEVVTALEAYRYAEAKVTKYFESNKRLATEHPLLADTAGGEGVRVPDPSKGQAQVALRTPVLLLGSLQKAAATPEKQQLLAQREAIETQIDRLKLRKAAMPSDQYRVELRGLLLQLARVQKELDQ